MQDFARKQRGAVSIFLILVLVPTLIIASIMVDSARIRSAKAVVTSASDLTLNTAMAQYDNVLKEMYGVFAVSQTEADLYKNLEEYFRKSIRCTGVDDKAADTYTTLINKIFRHELPDDATNLLGIKINEFTASNVGDKTCSLANPALLKSQIVNFMKYRAPINGGLAFLDSLRGFSHVGEQMEVIEKKNKYYKAQEDCINECQKAWEYIREYESYGLTEEFFKKKQKELDHYADAYKFIIKNIVKDYYTTTDKRYNGDLSKIFDTSVLTYYVPSSKEFYYRGKHVSDIKYPCSSDKFPGIKTIEDYISTFSARVSEYNAIKSKRYANLYDGDDKYKVQRVIQNIQNDLVDPSKSFFSGVRTIYVAKEVSQYMVDRMDIYIDEQKKVVKEKKKSLSEAKKKKGKDTSSYEKAVEAAEKELEKREKKKEELQKKHSKIEDGRYKTCMEDFARITYHSDTTSKTAMYETIVGTINMEIPIVNEVLDEKSNVENKLLKVDMKCRDKNGNYKYKDLVGATYSKDLHKRIVSSIQDFEDRLTNAKKALTNAKGCLDNIMKSIGPNGDLTTTLGNWREASNVTELQGDAVAEQSKEEIRSNEEFLNYDEVNALKEHIETIADVTLTDLIKEVQGYTLDGKEIQCRENFLRIEEAVKREAGTDLVKMTSIKEATLDNVAKTVFEKIYKEPYPNANTAKPQFTDHWDDVTKSPDVERSEPYNTKNSAGKDSYPYNKFYRFLKNNFEKVCKEKEEAEAKGEKVKDNDNSDSDEVEQSLKDSADTTKADAEKDDTSDGGAGGNIPTGTSPSRTWGSIIEDAAGFDVNSDDPTDNMGGNTKSFFASIGEALKDMAVTFRDDLYLSSYALDMFSYDTYVMEKKFNKLNNDTASIDQVKGVNIDAKELRSLTKIPINKAMNQGYRGEVEYLIYGKESLKSNVTAAYGTIFGIRFVFNTIYAFTDKEIGRATTYLANLFAWIPFMIPIIKVALTIAIALAESAIDLVHLKNGMKVPMYKTNETWNLSFEKLVKDVATKAVDTAVSVTKDATSKVIDKATEKLNTFLDMTDEDLSKMVDSASGEIQGFNDALAAKMDSTVDQYAMTAIDQVNAFAQEARRLSSTGLKGERIVNGTQTERQFVVQRLNEWKSQPYYSDIEREAKTIAVNYLISAECTFIDDTLNALDSYTETVSTTIQDSADTIKKQTQKVQQHINQLIQEQASKFNAYKKQVIDNAKGHIKNGAADLKQYVDDSLDGLGDKAQQRLSNVAPKFKDADRFAKVGGGTNRSAGAKATAQFFNFQYSDYLRLFLIIGLLANQDKVVLRMGDVIQSNVALQNSGFEMQKAYTYVKLDMNVDVKPILLSLPIMRSQSISQLDGVKWYTFEHSCMQGYN